MEGYRAGYDLDYGRRDFDNRRARMDVGSHGFDRGYPRGGERGRYDRPWVGGYREGYQGGSGGISVGTTGRSVGIRDDLQERGGYGRDYGRGRFGSHDRYATDYDVRPEEYRPRYSPIGGMAPTMGGSHKYRGNRAWPYDRWFNEWSRWF